MIGGWFEWTQRLSGPSALSMSAWLLVGIPAVVGALVMLSAHQYDLLEGLALSLGSWCALGLIWFISRSMLATNGGATSAVLWVMLAFILGSVARAAILALAMEALLILIMGTVYFTFLSVLFALLVESIRRHQAAVSRLKGLRRALQSASDRVESEIEYLRRSTQEAVVSALEVALREVSDPREVSFELRRVTQEVVRPMSHQFARGEPKPIQVTSTSVRGFQWRTLARAALDAKPCHPVLTTSIFMLNVSPIIAAYFGSDQFLNAMVVGSLAMFGVLQVGNWLPWRRMSIWLGSICFLLAVSLSGIVSSVLITRFVAPASELFSDGVLAVLFLVLIGLAVALVIGLDRYQPVVREGFIEMNSALAHAVSAANAQLRRERRQLGQVLHGVVQPRLVARAIQESDSQGTTEVGVLLEEVTAILSSAVEQPNSTNLQETLSDIQTVWSSTAEVDVHVTDEVDWICLNEPSLSKAVCEVACEAVHNAVLRGMAQYVRVDVTSGDGSITLCVTNPNSGAPLTSPYSEAGLGTQVYNSQTDSWDLYEGKGTVVFIARFTSLRVLTLSEQQGESLNPS